MPGALMVQQLVIAGFGVTVLRLRVAAPALLLLAMLAWTLVLLGIGAALGVLANSFSALSAWIAAIAPVSPGYWTVSAIRAATDGNVGPALTASAILAGFAVAAALPAGWRVAHSGLR